MLFSSITFLYAFLPLVLLFYFAAGSKYRNLILLIFSLIFYAWGEPKYVIVMIISILVGYVSGILTEKNLEKGKKNIAGICMLASVVLDLGLLFYFKYTDFFIENFARITGMDVKLLGLMLPLGISFYTFQILSYSIDVYKGEVKAQKNIITLATYITLFPQLIAGPIVRYQTVADELDNRYSKERFNKEESFDLFAEGVKKFVIGLGKKVIIANAVGDVYNQLSVLGPDKNTVVLSWLCSIMFSLQIYFDFSGYSDMAIGLGRIFGFHFLENFNYPYISKSITEFWRRWHISLSSWFKDYLYIPLGGNRKGDLRTVINLFIVWALTGFWHGAAWNFIVWGLYYFAFLMIEKYALNKVIDKIPAVIRHIYTLIIVNVGWVIFAYDDMGKLKDALKNMFFMNGLPMWNKETLFYVSSYAAILIIAVIGSTELPKKCVAKILGKNPVDNEIKTDEKADVTGKEKSETLETVLTVVAILAILVLSTALLASDSFNPFLYFRF